MSDWDFADGDGADRGGDGGPRPTRCDRGDGGDRSASTPPADLRAAYEGATDSLDDANQIADAEIAAARRPGHGRRPPSARRARRW